LLGVVDVVLAGTEAAVKAHLVAHILVLGADAGDLHHQIGELVLLVPGLPLRALAGSHVQGDVDVGSDVFSAVAPVVVNELVAARGEADARGQQALGPVDQ